MIELTPTERRALRAAAHHLNPVVSISQKGLTPGVLAEIDRSLKAHELIKLRLYGIERDDRETLCSEICTGLECALVQHIGNLLVLWRPRPDGETGSPTQKPRRPGVRETKKQAASRAERPRRRS